MPSRGQRRRDEPQFGPACRADALAIDRLAAGHAQRRQRDVERELADARTRRGRRSTRHADGGRWSVVVLPRRPWGEASAVLRHAQVGGLFLIRPRPTALSEARGGRTIAQSGRSSEFAWRRRSLSERPDLRRCLFDTARRPRSSGKLNIARATSLAPSDGRKYPWWMPPNLGSSSSHILPVSFEFGELIRIDFVSQVTSDHRLMLRRATNLALIVSLAASLRSRPNFAKDAYLVSLTRLVMKRD